MRTFLISILVTAASLMIIDLFSDSINFSGGSKTVLFLAFVISVLNSTVRPVFQVLAIPITILTLGLFYFVVNGFVLLIAFSFTKGAKIKNLTSAI